jgi:hypothetical protein
MPKAGTPFDRKILLTNRYASAIPATKLNIAEDKRVLS